MPKPRAQRPADPRFEAARHAFEGSPDVTADRMFGGPCLKVRGKLFAMVSSKGLFVVKLPAARVAALVAEGKGRPFEIGPHRRVMKAWLTFEGTPAECARLAQEAHGFVAGRP